MLIQSSNCFDSTRLVTYDGYLPLLSTLQGEPSDQEVTIINTDLGAVGLSGQPNYILQDFHTAYGIPTIWPYCESVNKCLVYSQPAAPAYKSPTVLCFPPGTSAVDFYIDAAIDCVKTLHAVVSCRAVVQPGNIDVKFRVKSICESPKVGKYIGFFDEEGEDIESVTIKCKSTYPNALGLIRIGSKQQPSLKQQGVTAARESATVEATV